MHISTAMTLARTASVLPSLALAGLMVTSFVAGCAVSPLAPQAIANQAYHESWTGNQENAIALFRMALAADPAFPYRWSDLGESLAESGKTEPARYCFRRSLELAPGSPQIAMRAANFLFREGETAPALQLSSSVLRMSPGWNNIVFSSWVRLGGDLQTILRNGVGTDPRAGEGFFRFLVGSAQAPGTDGAKVEATWRWLEGHSLVTRELAKTWTGWLLGRHRDADAFGVWKHYVSNEAGYGMTNRVDNSSFENLPGSEGFDWHLAPSAGVKTGIDASVAHSGRSSLRIEFEGSENVDFHHVFQQVWTPAGHYRLSAWVRTANLSTDQGVSLALDGVSTQTLTGTHDWTKVSADIRVGGTGAAGEVQVVRQRSLRFDSKPKGVVWIDDVLLERVD